MLKAILELLESFIKVGESELRAVRQSIRGVCAAMLLQLAGMVIGLFAAVMLFLAAFWAIGSALGPSLAGVITGGAALMLAMFLLMLASWRGK